ncbi:MAG TPA: hypothetical protein VIL99_16205 [Ignavibacteria bacterium]
MINLKKIKIPKNAIKIHLPDTNQLEDYSCGAALLKFCFAPYDETACNLAGVEIPAGNEKNISVSELGDIAINKYFNVTDKDLTNKGKYRVTVL